MLKIVDKFFCFLFILDKSPKKLLGYFPLKNINDSLPTKQYIDILHIATDYRFNVYNMMSALVYSRVVHPCSKLKTYDEVLPKLFKNTDFSLDQIYTGIEYIGWEYKKIIEIYNHQINLKYNFDTSHTYFDCTKAITFVKSLHCTYSNATAN